MKPVPMPPNLPEATTALGTVIKPKQWAECAHCKKLSPLEERKWIGLTDDEKEDMLKGSKNAYDAIERIEAALKAKNA
jgi:hypothetical protein